MAKIGNLLTRSYITGDGGTGGGTFVVTEYNIDNDFQIGPAEVTRLNVTPNFVNEVPRRVALESYQQNPVRVSFDATVIGGTVDERHAKFTKLMHVLNAPFLNENGMATIPSFGATQTPATVDPRYFKTGIYLREYATDVARTSGTKDYPPFWAGLLDGEVVEVSGEEYTTARLNFLCEPYRFGKSVTTLPSFSGTTTKTATITLDSTAPTPFAVTLAVTRASASDPFTVYFRARNTSTPSGFLHGGGGITVTYMPESTNQSLSTNITIDMLAQTAMATGNNPCSLSQYSTFFMLGEGTWTLTTNAGSVTNFSYWTRYF